MRFPGIYRRIHAVGTRLSEGSRWHETYTGGGTVPRLAAWRIGLGEWLVMESYLRRETHDELLTAFREAWRQAQEGETIPYKELFDDGT